jgi:thiol:disulfide interchange protein DsbA
LHARLFYVLQALHRKDLQEKVWDVIHKEQRPLVEKDEATSENLMLEFAVANGVKKEDFKQAWDSFGVNSNLQRAEQLTQRYHVDGVPLIVINGKYTTDVSKAGGPSQLLALINDLAASEKKR